MTGAMCIARLCLASLALAAATQSPVTKVVELIEELKAKIIADGKAEEQIYNRFACWCENTGKRKATDIHEAMASIKSLGTSILENKGLVATRTSEIAQLSQLIMANQKAQDEATGIRQKENKKYLEDNEEFKTTLASLESAVKALSGPASLLQMQNGEAGMALYRIGTDVHEAINKLPSGHLLSAEQLVLIQAFTNDPAAYYDQKASKAKAQNPASTTIVGIVKDMYDTFSMNLERATEVEAVAQKNYESVVGVKGREMKDLLTSRKKKDGEKAEAEKSMAQAAEMLDDTQAELKENVGFFDQLKPVCVSKAAEWQERVRARTEELAGVDKALGILTSDDAKALFNKSIQPGVATAFLQTDMDIDSDNHPKGKAYRVLKKLATKTQSLRLAEIAATLRLGGHFDGVIAEIEKMIVALKQEEKDDIEQRDWCKEETFKNEQEAARYEYKIQRLNAHTTKLQNKIEQLELSIGQTAGEILNTKNDIKNMEDTRKDEHAQFQQSKSDDEGAIELLGMAIESMSSYHKNDKTALLQQPVLEGMPDATFTDTDKNSQESGGIVSIMTMLKEELANEIKVAIKTEEKSQLEYEKELGEATKLLNELKVKKTTLESDMADTETLVGENDEENTELTELLKEEKDYLAGIKPDCDWILKNFADRRTKRGLEIEGLLEAKALLAGASPGLLETSQEFDDNEFPHMGFRGVSFLQKHQ